MDKPQPKTCLQFATWETEPDEDFSEHCKATSLPVIREIQGWEEEVKNEKDSRERGRLAWIKAVKKVRAVVRLALACKEINCYGTCTFERNKNSAYKHNSERQLQRIRLAKISGRHDEAPKPWYIVDPQSAFRKLWNGLTVLLLLYTALIMPYRIAFSEDQESQSWFIIERIIDGLFFLDVIITCFTALELSDGSLEMRLKRIVFRYFRTWMLIDIVACIPFSILDPQDQNTAITSSSYKSLFRMMRLPRLYRLLRITRLYRMVSNGKVNEIVERIQDCLSMNRGVSKVIWFAFTVIVCMHIVACLWYYLSSLQGFGPESWVSRTKMQNRSELQKYIACVYWAVATLTTVGYGDVVGTTDLERVFSVIWMVFGVILYGFTIGSLTSILLRINSKNSQLLVKLNAADQMVQESHLNEELKRQMRRALRHYSQRAELETKDKKMMFDSLPKKLRYEVVCAMYGGAVEKVGFFQGRSPEWVSSVIPFLRYSYLECGEYTYQVNDDSNELYVLLTGRADFILGKETMVFKRILEGSYFGDIEMMQRRKRLCSCAMESDGEILVMNRATLKLIETEFPEVFVEMETLAQKRLVRLLAAKNEVEDALEKMAIESGTIRRKGTERISDVECHLML